MRKLFLSVVAIILMLMLSVPASAKEPSKPELTLRDAVSLALKYSETLKRAEKEVDRTEAWREYRADKLSYTPIGPPGDPLIEITWTNLLTADLTYQMSKKSLGVEEDSVALDACNKYWAVQKALSAVDVAELALSQANLDLAKARTFYRIGMLTREALLGAEAQQEAARAALAKARNDVDIAYADFNRLVGLWPEDRPELAEEILFSPMEENDVNYLVVKILESSPSVWLAQEKVTLQKYLEDLMFYTGEYRPYQARKMEVEQAGLDAVSARKATEILARNLYYAVLTIEESIPAAEQAVKMAEENLRVAKLKQQVGMAVKADVTASEASLAQAGQKLLELKIQHSYLKLAMDKPWAYMRSAG